jgi:hypothetical protein
MDHIQRKTDSNLVADEEALSTVSNQEDERKRFIQNELEEPDSNLVADEEALSTVSNQEDDLEWKRFIQNELEELENQEKDEGKEDSEKTSSAGKKFNLSPLIEQIPVEQLIDSAIRIFFKKKIEPEKTEPEKTEPEKENRMEEANDYLKEAERLHKDMQKQMAEFYTYRDELFEQAEMKAQKVVEGAKDEAEEIIRELRKLRINSHASVKEQELIEARKRLENAVPTIERNKAAKTAKKKQEFHRGDVENRKKRTGKREQEKTAESLRQVLNALKANTDMKKLNRK